MDNQCISLSKTNSYMASYSEIVFEYYFKIIDFCNRRDPEGKEVGLNPDKIFVENDKSTSKLVIKDLQMSDSGVYELYAENDDYTKQINVTLLVEGKKISIMCIFIILY